MWNLSSMALSTVKQAKLLRPSPVSTLREIASRMLPSFRPHLSSQFEQPSGTACGPAVPTKDTSQQLQKVLLSSDALSSRVCKISPDISITGKASAECVPKLPRKAKPARDSEAVQAVLLRSF